MHPFGGTPICPRCNKAVYAAEQTMGPGRKLYHKPCLSCMNCRKRLDSYNLVEHDEEPYCKVCHVKTFGTKDLRHANLPDRDDVFISPPTSPTRTGRSLPPLSRSPPSTPSTAPPFPPRKTTTSGNVFNGPRAVSPTSPICQPTRRYSPVRPTSTDQTKSETLPVETKQDGRSDAKADDDWEPPAGNGAGFPSHTGRGTGGLPRTVPLGTGMYVASERPPSPTKAPHTPARATAEDQDKPTPSGYISVPLAPMSTGSRYGAALSGRMASPMSPMGTGRQWGGGTPVCPKCQKTVYFAEQVKAVGKTYHRNCLRCTECGTSLDSSRLTEKDGDPFCKHCYGKLYGPAGNGYALLGKAGG